MRFGKFAVNDSTDFELTYRVPERLFPLDIGTPCVLPVGPRTCVGIYLGECEMPAFACREITDKVPVVQPLQQNMLDLARWMSDYYLTSFVRCIGVLAPGFYWSAKAIPARLKRFSKFLKADHTISDPSNVLHSHVCGEQRFSAHPFELNAEQTVAIDNFFAAKQKVCLLYGVTGSGKTEVYLKAASRVLDEGKNVLVLVPEIALTPQMMGRFRAYFGDRLAVMHSMLTPVEYEREWLRMQYRLARIVLGVRTAIFAPLQNIGLIIVDEEHDSSYKSDEMPCYQARDVAVKRAVDCGARCLLGSATPSLESWNNQLIDKYHKITLSQRFSGNTSKFNVINARSHLLLKNKSSKGIDALKSSQVSFSGQVISKPLLSHLQHNFESGGQSMVILNRRGYANYGLCARCGHALTCPSCAVTTTIHNKGEQERCHYCNYSTKLRRNCPSCGANEITPMGTGTQNVEDEIATALPNMKIARLDRDVLTSNTRLAEILARFRSGDIDCLVGTQILAKGHDFPRVTLVAIIHIEDGLFLPDFRAGERTFQLLSQAAGRAGRGKVPGVVALQSLFTGHPIVELAIAGNTDSFLERELQVRALGWHPPFSRQILFEFMSKNQAKALEAAESVRKILIEHWTKQNIPAKDLRIAGPHPAALERLRDQWRFQICLSFAKCLSPCTVVPKAIQTEKKLRGLMRIDVDPVSFL